MVDINLLPQNERAVTKTDVWQLATWIWLPVLLGGLLVPYVITNGKANQIQAEINQMQQEIDRLLPQKQEYDQLSARQTALNEVTRVAETLRDQKSYWSNDLAAFNQVASQSNGVSLNSLTMSRFTPSELTQEQSNGIYVGKNITRRFTLLGRATDQQRLIEFLNNYEVNPQFGVKIQNIQELNESSDGKESTRYSFNADIGLAKELPTAPSDSPLAPAAGGGQ